MKNNQITLYRADLFRASVGSIEQRQLLIDEILEVKKNNPSGIEKSNINCWRYNYPCRDIDWLMKEILMLLDQAIDFYNDQDKIFNSRDRLDLIKVDYWANVNGPHSRNAVHAHKPAQFSAVYYLQAEQTGMIRFLNPSNIMAECNPGSPFTCDIAVEPKDGDLFLWPSWIPHEVETNFSDKDRINLAFDLTVKI